jgi:dsRNA-specific ribonuclease
MSAHPSFHQKDSHSYKRSTPFRIQDSSSASSGCYDPYNPKNKEITVAVVQAILSRYNVDKPIHDIRLYQRAFVHDSYLFPDETNTKRSLAPLALNENNCVPLKHKSNQRLEYLGDGVLECVTKFYLYRRFGGENEQFLTDKKIGLVNNMAIGSLAIAIGLNEWYLLAKPFESELRHSQKAMGCLFEAFIGAVFLDFNQCDDEDDDATDAGIPVNPFSATGMGFKMSMKFIEAVYETHVDWSRLIHLDENYKNILQTMIQKEFKQVPEYITMRPYSASQGGFNIGVYLRIDSRVNDARLKQVSSKSHRATISLQQFNNFRDIHEYAAEHKEVFIELAIGSHRHKTSAEQSAAMTALQLLNKMIENK